MPTRGYRGARLWVVAIAAATLLGPLYGPATQAAMPVDGCGGPVFRPDGQLWQCTFADDFDGTTIDTTRWLPIRTSATGFRSAKDCYVDSPETIGLRNGTLRLSVVRLAEKFLCEDPVHGSFTTRYAAGYVSTVGLFSQTYGRFEFRAKFPAATVPGLQSALWMWPVDGEKYGARPASGEIDVAEWFSSHPYQVVPHVHYLGEEWDVTKTSYTCYMLRADRFHTYTVEWGPKRIRITYDGKSCLVNRWFPYPGTTSAPFDHPFHLNLTQGLGVGDNAVQPRRTPLPATMVVDYVRAWR
ncbi:MAG TPA: glycoside hydrolase family 16 protein [Nocardioidaceae bacterium]|nr:glycoside hydrolase family 16 protein [Nocardioidaceae bacterium]